MNPSGFPSGAAPVAADFPAPRPAAPLPVRPLPGGYDPRDALPAGLVLSRDNEAALVAAYAALGRPLLPAEAVAAAGPALPYPAGLPRFVNSNPAIDGWAIDAVGPWRDGA